MLLAIWLMEGSPTFLKLSGIVMAMVGAIWYTYRKTHPQHHSAVSTSVELQDTKHYSDDDENDMERGSAKK